MTEVKRLFLLLSLVAGYFLLRVLSPILAPFLMGAILAYICNPVVTRLERWHVRRPLGVAVVMLAGLILLAGCLTVLVPFAYQQVSAFAERTPDYLKWIDTKAIPWLQGHLVGAGGKIDWGTMLRDRVTQNLGAVTGFLQTVLTRLMQSGKAVLVFFANLLLTLVIFGYLLGDWNRLRERAAALLPRRHEATVRTLAAEADEVLGAFLRGQLIVMLYVAVALSACLLAIGIDLAIPIGLFGGLVSFIPYVGSGVTAVLIALAALLQFHDALHPLLALGLYVLVNQVGDNLVTPRVVGNRIGVHPVAIIFAVMAGGRLFGLFGLVLAVPAAALLKVVGGHFLQRYRDSQLYTQPETRRRSLRRWRQGGRHV